MSFPAIESHTNFSKSYIPSTTLNLDIVNKCTWTWWHFFYLISPSKLLSIEVVTWKVWNLKDSDLHKCSEKEVTIPPLMRALTFDPQRLREFSKSFLGKPNKTVGSSCLWIMSEEQSPGKQNQILWKLTYTKFWKEKKIAVSALLFWGWQSYH